MRYLQNWDVTQESIKPILIATEMWKY